MATDDSRDGSVLVDNSGRPRTDNAQKASNSSLTIFMRFDVDALTVAKHYLRLKAFHPPLPTGYRFELLNARHSADVVRWRNDPDNHHGFLDPKTLTIETQRNFLENYRSHHRVDLVLIAEEEGKPIGVFALKNLNTDPELGLLLGEKSYRGKGLITSTMVAVLQFGFEWLSLPRIWVYKQKGHRARSRLRARFGFRVESEIRHNGAVYERLCLSREQFVKQTASGLAPQTLNFLTPPPRLGDSQEK